MPGYIFLNADKTDEADERVLREMLEAYFDTEHDPKQMPINQEVHQWIKIHIPECAILIKHNDAVVGSTFILPCSLALMEAFIHGKLNEAQLLEHVRVNQINYQNMQAIYFCAAFIVSPHRGKGLAFQALLSSIKQITPKGKKLPLFYWAYSPAGKQIAEKLAMTLNVGLFSLYSCDCYF
jgi:hypothetical protein